MGTVVEWSCPICGETQPPEAPGVAVEVRRLPRGRVRWTLSEPVVSCVQCAAHGRLTSPTGDEVQVYAPINRTDPAPCVVCGRLVVVAQSARRKTITCSSKCRAAQYRKPVTATEHKCEGCGETMTGRADRLYCSTACRQRAYRQRQQEPAVALAIPQPPKRGPRRKHRQVVESLNASMAGAAIAAAEVVELDQSITPAEAATFAAELARDLRTLSRLQRQLKVRAAVTTEPSATA